MIWVLFAVCLGLCLSAVYFLTKEGFASKFIACISLLLAMVLMVVMLMHVVPTLIIANVSGIYA